MGLLDWLRPKPTPPALDPPNRGTQRSPEDLERLRGLPEAKQSGKLRIPADVHDAAAWDTSQPTGWTQARRGELPRLFHVLRDLRSGREPHAGLRLHVPDELVEVAHRRVMR